MSHNDRFLSKVIASNMIRSQLVPTLRCIRLVRRRITSTTYSSPYIGRGMLPRKDFAASKQQTARSQQLRGVDERHTYLGNLGVLGDTQSEDYTVSLAPCAWLLALSNYRPCSEADIELRNDKSIRPSYFPRQTIQIAVALTCLTSTPFVHTLTSTLISCSSKLSSSRPLPCRLSLDAPSITISGTRYLKVANQTPPHRSPTARKTIGPMRRLSIGAVSTPTTNFVRYPFPALHVESY
jgi:hypothetical protein